MLVKENPDRKKIMMMIFFFSMIIQQNLLSKPYFQLGPLSEILSVTSAEEVAIRI